MTTFRRLEQVASSANMELVAEFVAGYRARIAAGMAVYGAFDPATDTRCLSREAIEECWGVGSYLEFLELKRPELTGRVQKIRAKTILLYGELKKLEEAERCPILGR